MTNGQSKPKLVLGAKTRKILEGRKINTKSDLEDWGRRDYSTIIDLVLFLLGRKLCSVNLTQLMTDISFSFYLTIEA